MLASAIGASLLPFQKQFEKYAKRNRAAAGGYAMFSFKFRRQRRENFEEKANYRAASAVNVFNFKRPRFSKAGKVQGKKANRVCACEDHVYGAAPRGKVTLEDLRCQ